jgi:Ni,Fe-hydrogenase III small subunit
MTRIPACRDPPAKLCLQNGDQCSCGSAYSSERSISVRTCNVYTLLQLYTVDIEIQGCPVCPSNKRCFIGPDLTESGILNLNNSTLMSHELLHEYTSAYTLSETPFSAFVLQVSRRYEDIGQVFLGDDLFRSLWFGYAKLLALDNDMECPSCGPTPTDVIFDGVTLAYTQKQIRAGLSPPTLVVKDHCLIRDKVKRVPFQSFLPHNFSARQEALKLLDVSSPITRQDDQLWQIVRSALSAEFNDVLLMMTMECFRDKPRTSHRELLRLVRIPF